MPLSSGRIAVFRPDRRARRIASRPSRSIRLAAQQDEVERTGDRVFRHRRRVRRSSRRAAADRQPGARELRRAPRAHEEGHVAAGLEQPAAEITADAPAPTTRMRIVLSLIAGPTAACRRVDFRRVSADIGVYTPMSSRGWEAMPRTSPLPAEPRAEDCVCLAAAAGRAACHAILRSAPRIDGAAHDAILDPIEAEAPRADDDQRARGRNGDGSHDARTQHPAARARRGSSPWRRAAPTGAARSCG